MTKHYQKMNPMLKIFLTHCWANIHLIIGISMGLSFSMMLIPVNVDNSNGNTEYSMHYLNYQDDLDEYEPKININSKPQQAQKVSKALVRPRYYSTELGIREKLFIGVITSQQYLYSRDIAINKTIAHIVDKVRYFISIPEGTKPNVTLPGIVGFTDTRSILKPFHTMKYIIDNYLENYDYYFLIKDVSYINVKKLVKFVTKISVSQNVHVGVLGDTPTYCSLDSGILLSNSIIQELKNNLDWCVKNAYSDSDDVNFGRCIVHSTSTPCSNHIQGQKFWHTKLKPTFLFEMNLKELVRNKEFLSSLVIYPIYDHLLAYKLNTYFAATKSVEIQEKISNIRKSILNMAILGPPQERNVSWPIGNQPGNKAIGRFDILRWSYFNQTHIFLNTDFSTVQELKTDAKFDIDRTINITASSIIADYQYTFKFNKLLNGYQKFDASRGMNYILDLEFTNVNTGKILRKRVEVCKPLGKVEILPVPYVTENTRINIILTINPSKKRDALNFLEHYAIDCMEKKYKTFLMMVLLYNFDSASKGRADIYYEIKQYALSLADKYKKQQSKITWLSVRLPNIVTTIETNQLLNIAIADLCIRKFSPESLILLVETGIQLRLDYLNRIRMNTINQYQVFSPIPFMEYHPDIAHMNDIKQVDTDINRNHGRYDEYNFNNIAFYVRDYNTMRKTTEASIPIIHSDRDISSMLNLSQNIPDTSLYEMFVSFSNLHILRAIEPALKVRYKNVDCFDTTDNISNFCTRSKNHHLGRRSQLARLILDYETYKNSLLR
ncbi:chondroitin polymerizing factor isoform X2 [Bombus vancouverensis nearcticus]|uniref:chondroitin sulfate synthase 2 n=1 Tax=Bombus vancouverensis nearcticus TaxID=2705178 RepID=UPI00143A1FF3|nr:chondroitin sulfate synthase 2 [Bombus vancouverensis nearcticus]